MSLRRSIFLKRLVRVEGRKVIARFLTHPRQAAVIAFPTHAEARRAAPALPAPRPRRPRPAPPPAAGGDRVPPACRGAARGLEAPRAAPALPLRRGVRRAAPLPRGSDPRVHRPRGGRRLTAHVSVD